MNLFSSVSSKLDLLQGTEMEKKVKAATDPSDAVVAMNDKIAIALATKRYDQYREIMPLIWKRLSENSGTWQVV
jgi:hypothetical protein